MTQLVSKCQGDLVLRRKKEQEQHRIQRHDAHKTLYALNKKTVCDKIEYGNHEYEGGEDIKRSKSLI